MGIKCLNILFWQLESMLSLFKLSTVLKQMNCLGKTIFIKLEEVMFLEFRRNSKKLRP